MRKTLTIDDDIAIQLEKIRPHQNAPLEQILDDALRRGLKALFQKTPLECISKPKLFHWGPV